MHNNKRQFQSRWYWPVQRRWQAGKLARKVESWATRGVGRDVASEPGAGIRKAISPQMASQQSCRIPRQALEFPQVNSFRALHAIISCSSGLTEAESLVLTHHASRRIVVSSSQRSPSKQHAGSGLRCLLSPVTHPAAR